MGVLIMNIANNKLYLARNKEGFLCAYDKDTKKCVDVIIGTGENLSEQQRQAMLGVPDPKATK